MQLTQPGDSQSNQANRLTFGRDNGSPTFTSGSNNNNPNVAPGLSQRNNFQQPSNSPIYPSYYSNMQPYSQSGAMYQPSAYVGLGGYGYPPNAIPAYGAGAYYGQGVYNPHSASVYGGSMSSLGYQQPQQYQQQFQQQLPQHFPYFRGGMGAQGLKPEEQKKVSQ